MNSDLLEIKSKLNIVDVLGEYIRVEKAGANFRALCPFHNEKSPSFMVSEERQMWHCFGCGKGGDMFSFVMEIEGLEFREALKLLAEKAGVKLSDFNPQKAQEKNRTLEILELATKWYEYQLWSGPGKTNALNYLRSRGLKDETIKVFRLGYAPRGWRNILSFLLNRGFKIEEIVKSGLLVEKRDAQIPNSKFQNPNQIQNSNDQNSKLKNQTSDRFYDRFRERIMFPVADYAGHVVGYSARVMPGQDESQAKYVNTPETEVYHKSKVLYGLDKAKSQIRQNNFVLLVEGNMDVVASWQAGLENTVAVSGTALTPEQVLMLKRYTRNIKMFFDMDSAGEAATKKSIKMALVNEMSVQVVQLPSGKDAADMARENQEDLRRAVAAALPAMEYVCQKSLSKFDKNTAEGKKKIVEEVLDMIESFENSVERNHWIKKTAEALDVAESALTDSLKRANLKNRIEGGQDNKVSFDFIAKEKIEILGNEIISLLMVSPQAWEKAAHLELTKWLPKDSLLSALLEKGHEVGFDFTKLLDGIAEPKERERAENLYFKKRYRLDLNNHLEELFIQNPEEELLAVVGEIKKEAGKNKLTKIIKDLKLAENRKDKNAIDFLRAEFKKISEDMEELHL